MITWAAAAPMPVTSSRRATAGSTGAPGPRLAPGPVTPSASTPHAPGIAAISSPARLVIVSMWAVRASIWSSSIRASSP
ncbi:MAG: hypothetical protein ACLQER_10940 [Streptosporangiaceae bacterium]